jgi:hypothetical protein
VCAPDGSPDAGAIWHYGDPLGEQRAAERVSVVVDRSNRAVITLTGPDRLKWLHSLSTQYVAESPDGACTANLSLDGQGRVEDHWQQTDLAGITYLDTEPWRGGPLLDSLKKMVFWSDVQPAEADLAVLSLLGPGVAGSAVLAALGVDALPEQARAVALAGGGPDAKRAGQVRDGGHRLPPIPDCRVRTDRAVRAGVVPLRTDKRPVGFPQLNHGHGIGGEQIAVNLGHARTVNKKLRRGAENFQSVGIQPWRRNWRIVSAPCRPRLRTCCKWSRSSGYVGSPGWKSWMPGQRGWC